jgi:hypothetical protein
VLFSLLLLGRSLRSDRKVLAREGTWCGWLGEFGMCGMCGATVVEKVFLCVLSDPYMAYVIFFTSSWVMMLYYMVFIVCQE